MTERRGKTVHLGAPSLGKLNEIGAFVGSNSGTMLIARFCNAVDAGELPNIDDLKLIAKALKPLGQTTKEDKSGNATSNLLSQFGCDIGIKVKQGRKADRKLKSFGYSLEMAVSVEFYLAQYDRNIKKGLREKQARTKAKSESAIAAGICVKAMGDRIKKYSSEAEMIKSLSFSEYETIKHWENPTERNILMNTKAYKYYCLLFE